MAYYYRANTYDPLEGDAGVIADARVPDVLVGVHLPPRENQVNSAASGVWADAESSGVCGLRSRVGGCDGLPWESGVAEACTAPVTQVKRS